MIHRIEPVCQTPAWQQALAGAFTDPEALIKYLRLDPSLLPEARRAAELFRLKVPREFAALIKKGDPNDPILRQVLPLQAELLNTPGFLSDPVGDMQTYTAPGVLHKYQGRLLLIASGSCAINCRYCFRRHFPYQEHTALHKHWSESADYILRSPEVKEVILSGGDPLTLSDNRLNELLGMLESIPHLQRLRIHSRLPVTIPQRITPYLLERLAASRLQTVMVLHINHSQEISNALKESAQAMRNSGMTLLNQSVLLKGVNDQADTLIQLSNALFDSGILPYYLHLLDRVQGAGHFEVEQTQALQLQEAMRNALPGYLMPRLVREIPGKAAKQPLV